MLEKEGIKKRREWKDEKGANMEEGEGVGGGGVPAWRAGDEGWRELGRAGDCGNISPRPLLARLGRASLNLKSG